MHREVCASQLSVTASTLGHFTKSFRISMHLVLGFPITRPVPLAWITRSRAITRLSISPSALARESQIVQSGTADGKARRRKVRTRQCVHLSFSNPNSAKDVQLSRYHRFEFAERRLFRLCRKIGRCVGSKTSYTSLRRFSCCSPSKTRLRPLPHIRSANPILSFLSSVVITRFSKRWPRPSTR